MSSTLRIEQGITAQELEQRIDSAPTGATLKFSSGNYRFDEAITITRSDMSFVGAGSEKTTLTFTDEALAGSEKYAIRLDGSESDTVGKLASSVDEGERQIRLDTSHGLKPGDTVRLWQDNDAAFFARIGDTSWRESNAPLRTSMAKVESVDGPSVTLDRGVHFDFDGSKTQVERIDALESVNLEGFSIGFELGTPDNTVFENTLADLKDYLAVSLEGTVDSHLADIQVNDGPSVAFHFAKALDTRAENIEAHGAFNKGGGGNGYAFELRESYDGSYTGLSDSGMRHSLLFASWRSSVGNDIHVESTDRDINFHGGRDHGNTVHVDQSVRGADNISTTLWINEGGVDWGAVTDAEANQVTFDYVMGSRRDDELQGSGDGVFFNGQLGSDTLIGGKGDDILQGGPGDDWGDDSLNGGGGNDTVLFAQDYEAYEIAFEGGDDAIIEGDGGNDTLTDIEQAIFADGTILDISARETTQGAIPEAPSAEGILGNDSSTSTVGEDVSPAEPEETPKEGSSTEQVVAAPSGEDATDADAPVAVTSNVTSSWDDGYVAEVSVENPSDDTIAVPEIQFDLSGDIEKLWGGQFSDHGDSYHVTSDDALAPGDVWRFGYKASGHTEAAPGNGTGEQDIQLLGVNSMQVDDLIG